jgi:quercetin dioxygenase-like cupin family protein
MLEGTIIPYTPGVISVIPADQVHRIEAGDKGLLLLATFSPPLV